MGRLRTGRSAGAAGGKPESGRWREIWGILTPADRVLALLLAAATLLVSASHFAAGPGARVEVHSAYETQVWPLDEARLERLEGPLGSSLVEVGAGRVRVVASPCPQQICVRRGWIWRRGDAIACVPNRLILTIVDGDAGPVDAVVR